MGMGTGSKTVANTTGLTTVAGVPLKYAMGGHGGTSCHEPPTKALPLIP